VSHHRINTETNEHYLLLDENILCQDHEHLDINDVYFSDNHEFMSYEVSYLGDELYDVKIFRLVEKDNNLEFIEIPNTIPKLKFGGHLWMPDNKRILYSTENETTHNFDKVYVYDLETNSSKLIYQENDVLFNVS